MALILFYSDSNPPAPLLHLLSPHLVMAFVGSRPRRNLREPSQSRDSNALRASVLEAALELGISSSRAVADLIFNTVDEEDEVRIPFFFALCSLPAFFFL